MPEAIKSLKKMTGLDCKGECEKPEKCFCYTTYADWEGWWRKNGKAFESKVVE